jgi:hypothetical protein
LSKSWRSANGFAGALGQDGYKVALYRFVGDGKLPERLALPWGKRLAKF